VITIYPMKVAVTAINNYPMMMNISPRPSATTYKVAFLEIMWKAILQEV